MANDDFLAYLQGRGQSFNAYAAGNKRYGTGRPNSNYGLNNKIGYMERDAAAQRRRNAMLRKLKAQGSGDLMSSAYLSPQGKP
jgi:hypothetical protein